MTTPSSENTVIFTIGHSTLALDDFVALLQAHGVEKLVDVRTMPRSRHNPQFNQETLPENLAAAGLGYVHLAGLGGWRRARPDSPNQGWRSEGFRGYADYMLTPEFAENLQLLIDLARQEQVAIMCAEAVPYRCHRSLIADALTVRGLRVEHIRGPKAAQLHRLTPFARVEGSRLTYPPEAEAVETQGGN